VLEVMIKRVGILGKSNLGFGLENIVKQQHLVLSSS